MGTSKSKRETPLMLSAPNRVKNRPSPAEAMPLSMLPRAMEPTSSRPMAARMKISPAPNLSTNFPRMGMHSSIMKPPKQPPLNEATLESSRASRACPL